MSESKFGTWSVAESPITIEYSLAAMEEMRHAVTEGFQRLSRGGIEVGGVMFGTREDGKVRILATREIACEHAKGPAFVLSDKDREGLAALLADCGEDPKLKGLAAVGWYLSHTRTEILLGASDLETYNQYFPAPWQVTLVLRPGRHGGMRAGFFVRESDGSVKADRSYLDFNLPDRLVAFDRLVTRTGPAPERRAQSYDRLEEQAPAAYLRAPRREPARPIVPLPPEAPRFLIEAPRPAGRKWLWLVAWGIAVAVGAVAGLHFYIEPSVAEPLSLAVLEKEGQLQIEWNRAAKPVAGAVRGALEIVDGKDPRVIALSRHDLTKGKITYQPKSGDVEIRLTVTAPDGGQSQEASRFLGPAAAAADPEQVAAFTRERDQLAAEVQRLRRGNDQQSARIQQLERTIRILESRLGIDRENK